MGECNNAAIFSKYESMIFPLVRNIYLDPGLLYGVDFMLHMEVIFAPPHRQLLKKGGHSFLGACLINLKTEIGNDPSPLRSGGRVVAE